MDYREKFLEASSFMEEFITEVNDFDSDSNQFFLRLDDSPFDYLKKGGNLLNLSPPKKVISMLEGGNDVMSFKSDYVPVDISPESVSEQFIGASPKKKTQIVNYINVISRYMDGIGKILDVGCGKGHLANYISQKFPHVSVCGMDNNHNSKKNVNKDTDVAKKNASKMGLKTEFVVGDAFESYDYLLDSGKNGVISLHGCGEVTHKVLESESADFISVSPCCYHTIKDSNYVMSEHAKNELQNGNLWFIGNSFGFILNRGSSDEPLSKRNIKHIQNLNQKTIDAIKNSNYVLNDRYTEMFESIGLDSKVNPDNLDDVVSKISDLSLRQLLFYRLFSKPGEALLTADKAIYLSERGYEPNVYEFIPSKVSARNYLITGCK